MKLYLQERFAQQNKIYWHEYKLVESPNEYLQKQKEKNDHTKDNISTFVSLFE